MFVAKGTDLNLQEQFERQFSASAVSALDTLLGVPANVQATQRGGNNNAYTPPPTNGTSGPTGNIEQAYMTARGAVATRSRGQDAPQIDGDSIKIRK